MKAVGHPHGQMHHGHGVFVECLCIERASMRQLLPIFTTVAQWGNQQHDIIRAAH
jgi:hypothetical protein